MGKVIEEGMRKILDKQYKERKFFRLPRYENWKDALSHLPRRRAGE
jgi:hypothetical protein